MTAQQGSHGSTSRKGLVDMRALVLGIALVVPNVNTLISDAPLFCIFFYFERFALPIDLRAQHNILKHEISSRAFLFLAGRVPTTDLNSPDRSEAHSLRNLGRAFVARVIGPPATVKSTSN